MGEKNQQSFHERIITRHLGSTKQWTQPSLEGQRGLLVELKSLRSPEDEWELRGREWVPGTPGSGERHGGRWSGGWESTCANAYRREGSGI